MINKNEGPFKRRAKQRKQNLSIHAPWAGVALAVIAITQFPTAIKTSLEIVCIIKLSNNNVSRTNWCNHLKTSTSRSSKMTSHHLLPSFE